MNWFALKAIYGREMLRFYRTIVQSLISPVLSTALYFVVFGSAIGSRIDEVSGVDYGAFIVPGLIMLSVLTQGTSNASFGIFFPKMQGTLYEMLAAPVNFFEITLGIVGGAATKSLIIGTIILATSFFFVPMQIAHPAMVALFLFLTCLSFSLLGFIIGIWATRIDQLTLIPMLILTPLTFLGGSFYSADMLPPFWQAVTHFNPVFYLVSGFRWAFFEVSEVPVGLSIGAVAIFTLICTAIIARIFQTGWRIRA